MGGCLHITHEIGQCKEEAAQAGVYGRAYLLSDTARSLYSLRIPKHTDKGTLHIPPRWQACCLSGETRYGITVGYNSFYFSVEPLRGSSLLLSHTAGSLRSPAVKHRRAASPPYAFYPTVYTFSFFPFSATPSPKGANHA